MKNIKVFLYTDNALIVDAVFGLALKRNIIDSADINIYRKQETDNLLSLQNYNLIIVDESVSEAELTIALKGTSNFILRVNCSSSNSKPSSQRKVLDLRLDQLKDYICDYFNSPEK